MNDDAWALVRDGYEPAGLAKDETLFSVGNGMLGLRGDHEEGFPSFHRGTYLNGFFDTEPIAYGESAYGYAKQHQTMLNAPDAKRFALEVDGEPFRLDRAERLSVRRNLDMRSGQLLRSIEVRLKSGAVLRIESGRMACQRRASTAAFFYQVSLVSGTARVSVRSGVDGGVRNLGAEDDPRVGAKFVEPPLSVQSASAREGSVLLEAATRRSGMRLACAACFKAEALGPGTGERRELAGLPELDSLSAGFVWSLELKAGGSLRIEKTAAYAMARDGERADLAASARGDAADALALGYQALADEQRTALDAFWADADVRISGAIEMQEALRFAIFHLYQSAGRDGRTSLCAKGLTGEGYEGHYFWDTEIYACPVFTYTRPEIARSLLAYRHATLGKARERAATMSQKGALFPWRSIDGEETSAYYPAGTAQYHIDADIAFACAKYLAATGDLAFRRSEAAELAVETARLWLSLGNFGSDGAFHICCVTGPDEYTALVDDNAYTNYMARANLRFAASLVEELAALAASGEPGPLERLRQRTGYEAAEAAAWRQAAAAMKLPFDGELGIVPQDAAFLSRPLWDFAGTSPDKYPLLLNFHPLVIYRHRVLKQPDAVLAEFLLSDEFSLAQKIRDFRYYEPLTTGDSSLSHCVQSVVAAELGDSDKAYEYFRKTARMDLDDVHGNARDGIHAAAMAGSWISAIYGFAGFRDYAGIWSFEPRLPKAWKGLAFSLLLGGERLSVDIAGDQVTYSLSGKDAAGGGELEFRHRGETLRLARGESRTLSLKPRLRAALFDLDGVVADTANLHIEAWKHTAEEFGVPFHPSVGERIKGVPREGSLDIVLEAGGKTLSPRDRATALERKNRRFVEAIETVGPSDVLPGVAKLLEDLRARKVAIVLASSSKNAPAIVERLGLADYFDAVVNPASLVKGKPDPEIFLRGAELAGVYRLDCVGFEDAQAGLDAIKAAGMKAVSIGAGLEGGDLRLASTAELDIKAIEALFA